MSETQGPGLTGLGKIVSALMILGIIGVGVYVVMQSRARTTDGTAQSGGANSAVGGRTADAQAPDTPAGSVTIGIAYGTEKRRWLEDAARDFAQTPAGKSIKINLIPTGSLEGAQKLLAGDKGIQVWSPASSLYKDTFVQDWQVKYGNSPIAKEEVLALTPMVFVIWEERYQAFAQKYSTVNFKTIGQASMEKGGWDAIAGRPTNWGFFKFGHTHPNRSNSGLMSLALMAYDATGKTRNLKLEDITNIEFQNWFQTFEQAVVGLSDSTGTMMKEMTLKGPSTYDALLVYENVVIDFLEPAQGRWGGLRVIYPDKNMWNDNPYYIIDAPWCSAEQRKAAETFLEFLMSEPVQRKAMIHGFRPGNVNVTSIREQDSPFIRYQKYGLKIDIPSVCEPPKAEIINNLLIAWQRARGST